MTHRGRQRMRTLLLCLAVSALAFGTASARTWTVNKDGTGDFVQVFEAMDAIDHGDTVLISAGVYPDLRRVELPGIAGPASALVTKNDITIRGTDRDSVIIGPEEPNISGFWPKGIIAYPGTGLRVEDLTIRNLNDGMFLERRAMLRNLRIEGNRNHGVVTFKDAVLDVSDCEFVGNVTGLLVSSDGDSLRVRDSSFDDLGTGITVIGMPATLERIRVIGSAIGVDAKSGANVGIRESVFADTGTIGVNATVGATVTIWDCEFSGGAENICVGGGASLYGSGNLLEGATLASILVDIVGTVEFTGNDILAGTGHAVRFHKLWIEPYTIDVTDNYWGTADRDAIMELIHDANDGEPGVTGTAIFEPFALRTVEVEKPSMGGFKARFRQ